MFNKKTYKKLIIGFLAMAMIFGSKALGAGSIYSKKIDAVFGEINFTYEGSDITSEIDEKYGTPVFTYNSRAYVPVRAIGDLLAMNIDYDTITNSVNITRTEKAGSQKLLDERNKEIKVLKRKINKLKGIEDESIKIILNDIEENLNKKYRTYGGLDFDIILKEEKDDIFIQIKTDLSLTQPRENWIQIKHGEKNDLIEDVIFQVVECFPEYHIKGNIYDESTKENLYEFYKKEKEDLDIVNKDYIDQGYYYDRFYDFSDNRDKVEEKVERIFYSKEIEDAKLYRLDYTSKTASFEIEFSNKYKELWEDLDKKEKEDMLKDVVEEVEYENDHIEKVYGDIFMGVRRVGRYEKEDQGLGKFYE